MSTPVPNPPRGKGMTFPFSHAPSLIQQEGEPDVFSRGQPRAIRLPPQRCGSSPRKRLCFGSASHAQQSSFWVLQSHAQCKGWGWSLWRRGARACGTQAHTEHPRALEPRSSCCPALQEPLTGGGHHRVSNGCCITFPDAPSLFSPNRTKLSSKRRFLSNSWPKIKVQTKLNGARSLIWQGKFPLQFWSLFTTLKVGQTGLRWRNRFGKWSLRGKASKRQTTALQCFQGTLSLPSEQFSFTTQSWNSVTWNYGFLFKLLKFSNLLEQIN